MYRTFEKSRALPICGPDVVVKHSVTLPPKLDGGSTYDPSEFERQK